MQDICRSHKNGAASIYLFKAASASALETASLFAYRANSAQRDAALGLFSRSRNSYLQIENPLQKSTSAILSGWFVEPENCGSPASRSWHFRSSCSQSCGRLGVYLTRGEISRGGLGGAHDRTPCLQGKEYKFKRRVARICDPRSQLLPQRRAPMRS